jgi:hypothetical protein
MRSFCGGQFDREQTFPPTGEMEDAVPGIQSRDEKLGWEFLVAERLPVLSI